MPQSILIRNMVCHRCVLAVMDILHEEAIPYKDVTIGEIHLTAPLTDEQKNRLADRIRGIGFDLIGNPGAAMIESIKQLVIKKARNEVSEKDARLNLSAYITSHVHNEYTYLSHLFSSIEGRTIESYFIEQRIEKAKELLVYGELTLSQIAFDLEYSSVAHLSSQFKKVTGLTPTHFKQIGISKRRSLDRI